MYVEWAAEHFGFGSVYLPVISHYRTSRYTPGSRCNMALPDYCRQISQKRSNSSTGEMYSTICVKWAGDRFGLGDPRLTKMCTKMIYASNSVRLFIYSCSALCFHYFRRFYFLGLYGFPSSRKSEARPHGTDGRTDRRTGYNT